MFDVRERKTSIFRSLKLRRVPHPPVAFTPIYPDPVGASGFIRTFSAPSASQ
jgi:hypothetical protein